VRETRVTLPFRHAYIPSKQRGSKGTREWGGGGGGGGERLIQGSSAYLEEALEAVGFGVEIIHQ